MKVVTVRAIGTKVGNRVRIGDEWWEPGKPQPEKGHEDSGDETATGELASYAAQVRQEPVFVTDHGKPVMALMPIENADLETVSLSTDPLFIALIERSRALYKPGAGIPLAEIKRKHAIKSKPKPARRSGKTR